MPVIKGWKFPIQVDEVTGKIKTVEDNENVKQSVRVILETQKHERKIYPIFGTDLRSYMFDIVTPNFISGLKKEITAALETWESHIDDLNVAVKASSGPISKVEVAIDYITDIEPVQERVKKNLNPNQL